MNEKIVGSPNLKTGFQGLHLITIRFAFKAPDLISEEAAADRATRTLSTWSLAVGVLNSLSE